MEGTRSRLGGCSKGTPSSSRRGLGGGCEVARGVDRSSSAGSWRGLGSVPDGGLGGHSNVTPSPPSKSSRTKLGRVGERTRRGPGGDSDGTRRGLRSHNIVNHHKHPDSYYRHVRSCQVTMFGKLTIVKPATDNFHFGVFCHLSICVYRTSTFDNLTIDDDAIYDNYISHRSYGNSHGYGIYANRASSEPMP